MRALFSLAGGVFESVATFPLEIVRSSRGPKVRGLGVVRAVPASCLFVGSVEPNAYRWLVRVAVLVVALLLPPGQLLGAEVLCSTDVDGNGQTDA